MYEIQPDVKTSSEMLYGIGKLASRYGVGVQLLETSLNAVILETTEGLYND